MSLLSLSSLELILPDGRALFRNLDLILPPGKHGLVGPNGIGKSMLARLITRELEPSSGRVMTACAPDLVSQVSGRPDLLLVEYLADVWALAAPGSAGLRDRFLKRLDLGLRCTELSQGAWMRARLLKALTRSRGFLILDEPTNHLDRDGREAVADFVESTSDSLLIITHDRSLLARVESIVELSNRGISVYGGNWPAYAELRERERAALERDADRARKEKRIAELERRRKLETQERRQRSATRSAADLGLPKIVLGARKRQGERTAARLDTRTRIRIAAADEAARSAIESVKFDPSIYAELPAPEIPASRMVLEAVDFNFILERPEIGSRALWDRPLSFRFSGPARVRLSGANGSGKTTFIQALLGKDIRYGRQVGSLRLGRIRASVLDPGDAVLDSRLTVVELFARHARMSEGSARSILARFLFQRERVHTPVEALSGGERVRLLLALALASASPPDLLIFDEPTNHLDLSGTEFLEEALSGFPGALLVVTHDPEFADRLGLEDEIPLQPSPRA